MSTVCRRLLCRETLRLLPLWWQHSLDPLDESPLGLKCRCSPQWSSLRLATNTAGVWLQSVALTVQSLDGRTTDLSTLADQQVHSWSGGVKVPEPHHLGPSVGDVGPVVWQRHANHSNTKQHVDHGYDEQQHDSCVVAPSSWWWSKWTSSCAAF